MWAVNLRFQLVRRDRKFATTGEDDALLRLCFAEATIGIILTIRMERESLKSAKSAQIKSFKLEGAFITMRIFFSDLTNDFSTQ